MLRSQNEIANKQNEMIITIENIEMQRLRLDQVDKTIEKIHEDIDKKEAKIATIEAFVDRFVPIRI